jgi:hypothetical protein
MGTLPNSRYDFENLQEIATTLTPKTDDTYDIGSSTKEFKDGFFDGTVHADALEMGGSITLTGGQSIVTTGNGNINLLPNGTGITKIGDAGNTSHSLDSNDDCLITGELEVDGATYFDGAVICGSTFNASAFNVRLRYVDFASSHTVAFQSTGGSSLACKDIYEEVTIPVGSGLDPVVVSSTNLAPANSIIKAVAVRVTQAPGGGATTVSVGRSSGGNTDEFISAISTALGTTGNHIANNDGVLAAEDMWNATDDTFTVSTDADVTGTAMKIRIVVWYEQVTAPVG